MPFTNCLFRHTLFAVFHMDRLFHQAVQWHGGKVCLHMQIPMMAAGTSGCSPVAVEMYFHKDIPAFEALVLDQLHDDTCPFPVAAGQSLS